jgi:flagellar FliL protein
MAKEAAEPKKGGKKKIVMIVVGLVVAGVGAKLTVLKGKADAKEPAKAVEPVEGEIVEIGSLTVNLADADRHYARVGIGLVANATAHAEEVKARIPLLKDAAITAIGTHTSAELRTSAGREALRKELLEAADEVWEPHTILQIALTELLVQ